MLTKKILRSLKSSSQFTSGQLSRFFADLPEHEVLTMPSLSPTMEKGKIAQWNFKVGDEVGPGDVIADIETDKSNVGYEVQEDGYIAKILTGEGEEAPIGNPIAIVVLDEDDIAAFENYAPGQEQADTGAGQQEAAQPEPEVEEEAEEEEEDLPEHTVITMPSLSPTMTDGKIAEWNFSIGDEVGPGDILADIETDKSNVGYEVQEDGYLAQILAEAGKDKVLLGAPIAVIVPDEDDIPAFANFDPSKKPAPKKKAAQPAQQEEPQTSQPQTQQKQPASSGQRSTGDRVYISPLAKKLLLEQGVDLALASRITGSGPRGRIIAKDVESLDVSSLEQDVTHAVTGAGVTTTSVSVPQPAEGVEYEDIPVSGMRGVIAQRLTESKQSIPHYYETIGIRMDALLALRKNINQNSGTKISVNDMIIKAASLSCEDVPEVNSQWMGDFVRRFEDVDVSFAVAIDDGLITPIVRYANDKRLSEIAEDTQDLIQKAKGNKLSPQEYQGGTFTISNLGMFGIQQFTSIINMPQACILAVGATEKKPVFNADAENNIEWVNEMLVTLSSDHRVVDGAVAAQWLNRFKHYMENPMNMLI